MHAPPQILLLHGPSRLSVCVTAPRCPAALLRSILAAHTGLCRPVFHPVSCNIPHFTCPLSLHSVVAQRVDFVLCRGCPLRHGKHN